MTRKMLSLLVTSAVAASLLYGEVWESNALSMRLKPLSEAPESGYYLLADPESEILYLDGNVVREKRNLPSGFSITEDGSTTTYTLDEAGRPLRIESDGIITQNVYSDSGLLLSSTLTGEDGLESISEYHWSPEGKLMFVEEFDTRYYLPSSGFHYTSGDVTWGINTETPDVFLEKLGADRSKAERIDGGVKLLSSDGSERTYSDDGLLLHEKRNGFTYDYTYEDGIRTCMTESRDGKTTRFLYEDGILKVREYLLGNVMRRRQTVNEDGSMTEERYRDGKPYAKVEYDRDQKTIRSIESL